MRDVRDVREVREVLKMGPYSQRIWEQNRRRFA